MIAFFDRNLYHSLNAILVIETKYLRTKRNPILKTDLTPVISYGFSTNFEFMGFLLSIFYAHLYWREGSFKLRNAIPPTANNLKLLSIFNI